jgi:hypothetical protein
MTRLTLLIALILTASSAAAEDTIIPIIFRSYYTSDSEYPGIHVVNNGMTRDSKFVRFTDTRITRTDHNGLIEAADGYLICKAQLLWSQTNMNGPDSTFNANLSADRKVFGYLTAKPDNEPRPDSVVRLTVALSPMEFKIACKMASFGYAARVPWQGREIALRCSQAASLDNPGWC